jgi:hypothetical protein
MALYKERVLPVLNDWESEVGNYEVDTDSYTSAHLTEFMTKRSKSDDPPPLTVVV